MATTGDPELAVDTLARRLRHACRRNRVGRNQAFTRAQAKKDDNE
jgi:hypothetical protein